MMTQKTNNPALTPMVGARLGAEVAATIGSNVVTRGFEHLLRMPHDAAVNFVRDKVVLPELTRIEALMDNHLPGLVTQKDKRERHQLPSDVRAQALATNILHLGIDFLSGLVTQVYGQKFFDQMLRVPGITDAQQFKVAFIDRTCQLGAFGLLNTLGSQANLGLQVRLKTMYMKLFAPWGLDEDRAESMARRTVNMHLPNLAGMIGSLAAHYNFSKR
jgi:hypothetical protein